MLNKHFPNFIEGGFSRHPCYSNCYYNVSIVGRLVSLPNLKVKLWHELFVTEVWTEIRSCSGSQRKSLTVACRNIQQYNYAFSLHLLISRCLNINIVWSLSGSYINHVDLIKHCHLTNWTLLVKSTIYLKKSLHYKYLKKSDFFLNLSFMVTHDEDFVI